MVVADQGQDYNSTPEIEITSTDNSGLGAIVRPVIQDGKLIDAIVINSGIGYSATTTSADVVPRWYKWCI